MHVLKQIGKKEEEKDEADSQDVHEEVHHDSGMIKIAPRLHAAEGVEGTQKRQGRGNKEEEGGAAGGKAGDTKRGGEASQHQQVAAQQRPAAEVEDGEG